MDPNIRPEKQVMKPMVTFDAKKSISQIKPRLGQGRAGIKQETIKLPVSLPIDKPIIQIIEKPKLQ